MIGPAVQLSMENGVCIAITTTQGEDNYITDLSNKVDKHGKPIALTVKITTICDDCKDKTTDMTCIHNEAYVAPWKRANSSLSEALFGDNRNHALREMAGIVVSDQVYVFRKWMKAFESRSVYLFRNPRVKYVFVQIDPSAGGKSFYAMVTLACEEHNYVVSGFILAWKQQQGSYSYTECTQNVHRIIWSDTEITAVRTIEPDS